MEFMSGEFPGHSRTGIPLRSRNILVLELWHDVRSYIRIYPFFRNTTAFICHFKIMNNITPVICTFHFTIHTSLERKASVPNGSPDLHTCWQFYSSLNTLSILFHILFAPNTTAASSVLTVKYRLM